MKSKNEIDNRLKKDLPHYKCARSDIMEKIIKNFRGHKKCIDGINRAEKKSKRKL